MWRSTITGNSINDFINTGRITSSVISNNSMTGSMDIEDIFFTQITNNNFSNIYSQEIFDSVISWNTIRGQIQSTHRSKSCVISNNKLFDSTNYGMWTYINGWYNSCESIITGAKTNSRFADNWMVMGNMTDTTFTWNFVRNSSFNKPTYILNWKGNPKNTHEKHNRMMNLINAIPLLKINTIKWIVITRNITSQEKKFKNIM